MGDDPLRWGEMEYRQPPPFFKMGADRYFHLSNEADGTFAWLYVVGPRLFGEYRPFCPARDATTDEWSHPTVLPTKTIEDSMKYLESLVRMSS